MSYVLGIDPSSKSVALCALPLGGTAAKHVKFTLPTAGNVMAIRCNEAWEAVFKFVRSVNVELACLEAPYVGRSARATIMQCFVSGAVQAALARAGVGVALVPPATWKKEMTGHGNATKGDFALWLGDHYPRLARGCGADQDLIDATALALYGIALQGRRARLAGPGGVQESAASVL